MYRRLPPSLPISEAIDGAPTLARLASQVKQSGDMLRDVRELLPMTIQVQAGPLQDQQWSLLVNSSAAAAKLRQLLPSLLGRLKQRGWPVDRIQVKILDPGKA
jgi:Dna[CI] antecedent, DciA